MYLFLKRMSILFVCGGILFAMQGFAQPRYSVVTTVAQLADPLATIVGNCAQVESILGSGTDPHLYRLARADVRKLRQADMIFFVGHLLEAQMVHLLSELGRTKPVYAAGEMIEEKYLLEVSPRVYDPHLWMSPLVWKQVIAVAVERLSIALPDCRAQLAAATAAYFSRLEKLDGIIEDILQQVPESRRVLVTSHDAFGYLGRSYDLEVLAVQGLSTDRQVSVKKIDNLVETLVTRRIPVVFIETSVSPRDMRAVMEGTAQRGHSLRLGGTLFSDAMGTGETGTYIGMLKHNVRLIAASFFLELQLSQLLDDLQEL